ncbi:MAG TPA: hypothetical protein VK081_15075 [Planctomycetota bacterium]|nr:hypothetical protein [Planctomycetota bacterium]
MRSLVAPAALTLSALLSAQQNPIGYPADTVRLGSGNLTPFGFSTQPTADEGHWQQLILAHHLPSTPCLITGIAAHCQSANFTVTYTSLVITLSETTATTLGTSASGNLPNPVTVLNVSNFPVQWQQNQWVDIQFTYPFQFSGNANLVVSIQKIYDRSTYPSSSIVTHQTTGSPHRTDLVPARYAFSPLGGGAATTDLLNQSSSAVLSMRLYTTADATTTLKSQSTGTEYQRGFAADYTLWGAPGTAWAAFLDTAVQPPISLPFFQGRLYVNPSIMFASGVNLGSSSNVTIPLPNLQSFADSYWTIQSAVASPVFNISVTNVADFFIR